jgi:threonine dehydrogenase-like Zn-dependent dehydrogenase
MPRDLDDHHLIFLTDIFPTGYMAAENAQVSVGDTVAIWGAGPVGQFAIQSAWLLGAGRVISIDKVPERLQLAATKGKAEVINSDNENVVEKLRSMTGGRGPDACIDAVGMEATGHTPDAVYDKVKQAMRLETDRPTALREAITACRKGGTVSIPGVYGGLLDKFPLGAAFGKGLTFKMGQTHIHNYLKPLLERIEKGEIDPTFIITHRLSLEEAPGAYHMFREKQDGCIKVVLKP